MTETYSQQLRRQRRENVHRDGAREGIDALVSRLMLRLPVSDPLDLLDVAEGVKAAYPRVWNGRD